MQCEIISRYYNSMDSILESERIPRDYGIGTNLYNSEIDFINTVNAHPNQNATELAKLLNVTRGAISQLGNKLEEKGLVQRNSSEANRKEKYFELTDLGKGIVEKHHEYHSEANDEICKYLSGLKYDERMAIIEFLEMIAELPISKFKCKCDTCYGKDII
ncbi:MAG: MarR family transcriptional regulator [Tissierellia bacterium]|nr:MarR family transcriptional regulator [Tissierellia bacterium]